MSYSMSDLLQLVVSGRVNTIDLANSLTAEDPVEFDIEGIMQMAINEAYGMTFAKALKSFLRQDPDIIMVGEMRDGNRADFHPCIADRPLGLEHAVPTIHPAPSPVCIWAWSRS